MNSKRKYACMYCGGSVLLSLEEKNALEVIACEKCRKLYENTYEDESHELLEKAILVAGKAVKHMAEKYENKNKKDGGDTDN